MNFSSEITDTFLENVQTLNKAHDELIQFELNYYKNKPKGRGFINWVYKQIHHYISYECQIDDIEYKSYDALYWFNTTDKMPETIEENIKYSKEVLERMENNMEYSQAFLNTKEKLSQNIEILEHIQNPKKIINSVQKIIHT